MKRMDILVVFIFVACSVNLIGAQNSYTVTVVEYARTRDSTLSDYDNILQRTQEYVNLIKSSTTHIIVFPEYGLTTTNLPENLTTISTAVPDPLDNVTPCTNSNGFAKHLIDLSCIAREHKTYVVVNLIERNTTPANTTIHYNTNVVFDVTGKVIARYRKINLCNEPMLTRGQNITTFDAFGLKFGLMTSCDLLFYNPALSLVNNNITDIIYPHSWISETPFLQSLSLQDGFAKANGINFLSSSYSNGTAGMGGYGIFLADASIAAMDISSVIGTQRLNANVSRISAATPQKVCENNLEIAPRWGGQLPGIDRFNTRIENLELYTFKDLEIIQDEARVQVCSEGSSFCCDFYVKFNNETINVISAYKVTAFFGTKRVNDTSQTLGFRTCALVACATNNIGSCEKRSRESNTHFESITIKTNVPSTEKALYMPSTLGNDLKPLKNYAYCKNEDKENNEIGITMSVDNVDNLLTFGIFGRVYDMDGQPEGRGNADYVRCTLGLIITLLVSHFLIQ